MPLSAVSVPAVAVWLPRNCTAASDPLVGATLPDQFDAVDQVDELAAVFVQLIVGSAGKSALGGMISRAWLALDQDNCASARFPCPGNIAS